MRIRDLIFDLQDTMADWGNVEVRAANPQNSHITGTYVARLSDNGQMTLLLNLEGSD